MRRALGVFVLVLVWFALFDVPSAVAICRHAPIWLAATIGGLCVAAPFAWHLLRERKRAGGPAKATLRGWDRLVLRTLVIAVLVGGASWAVAKPSLWTALKHHWDWMFPRSDKLSATSALLDRVPASAEGVVWIRAGESPALAEKLEAIGGMSADDAVEAVAAGGGDDGMLAVRGSTDVVDGIHRLLAFAGGYGDLGVREHDLDGGATEWSTPAWENPKDRATALMALLERAPSDAAIVFAAKPRPAAHHRKHASDEVVSADGWIRADDERIEVEVEVEASSEPAARAIVTDLEVAANTTPEARCFDGAWSATHDDARVTVHAELAIDDLPALATCLK